MRRAYNLYPSLLDSFNLLRSYDGETAELVTQEELIKRINKEPRPYIEAAAKGTAFEKSVREFYLRGNDKIKNELPISCDGFEFDRRLISHFAERLAGGVWNIYTELNLSLSDYDLKLYGYVDCVRLFTCYDVKAPGSYTYGKYEAGLQRHFYPLALRSDGIQVEEFEYFITDFKEHYKECYSVNESESLAVLMEASDSFIEFLENNRQKITNKKIFNL